MARTQEIIECRMRLQKEVEKIDGLFILGEPQAMILCFGSDAFPVRGGVPSHPNLSPTPAPEIKPKPNPDQACVLEEALGFEVYILLRVRVRVRVRPP